MITIIAIVSGLLNLFFVGLRVAESIYELKKNPELDTMGEIWQVIKNFFRVEKYG